MTNATTPLKDYDSVDINSAPGTKMVFLGINGHPSELKLALSVLEVGKTYTLKSTNIHNCYTGFELVELPGKVLNSVMFGLPPKEQKKLSDWCIDVIWRRIHILEGRERAHLNRRELLSAIWDYDPMNPSTFDAINLSEVQLKDILGLPVSHFNCLKYMQEVQELHTLRAITQI